MKEDITTDTTEIQRVITDYYEPLYANILDYLEKNNLLGQNHEEIENLNKPIK